MKRGIEHCATGKPGVTCMQPVVCLAVFISLLPHVKLTYISSRENVGHETRVENTFVGMTVPPCLQ